MRHMDMHESGNVVSQPAKQKKTFAVKEIAKIGILSAVAALLMLLELPLFFVPGFYKLDFSEVMVLLGAFSMGPVAGIVIEGVKILLNFALDGSTTAGIGELANFLIGCSLIVPAAIVYKRKKTRKNAMIGLITGIVLMATVSAILNYYVLIPVYSFAYELPLEKIIGMGTKINPAIQNLKQFVLYATIPFNLVKGILSGALTLLIYKKVSTLLHR